MTTDASRLECPICTYWEGFWSNEALGQLSFNGGLLSRRQQLAHQFSHHDDEEGAARQVGSSQIGIQNGHVPCLGRSENEACGSIPVAGQNVVQEAPLTGRESSSSETYCGESSIVHLPPEVASTADLHIAPSRDGGATETEASLGRLVDSELGVAWHWPSPALPGTYEVTRDGSPLFALAVNLPPEESRLECPSEDVLTERLGSGRKVSYRGAHATGPSRDDLWNTLLAVCVVLLIAEVTSLLVFRT